MENKKKYIFPMNYKQKEKFMGVIDYKVLVVCGIFLAIIFFIVKNLSVTLFSKIVTFIVVAGCPTIFILIGINGENMVDFIYFIFKFFIKCKVYVYRNDDKVTGIVKLYKKLVFYKRY